VTGPIRPTGHWWHGYAVSCVTSAIDIAASRTAIRFIPAHEILARNSAPLAIPLGGGRLIPDQIFALDYGGRYRVFALEVDRGTEPARSASVRKSWARSIATYRQVFERGLHKSHYGLKSNLLALWVFYSPAKETRFLELVQQQGGPLGDAVLTQSVASPAGTTADFLAHVEMYEDAWNRPDGRIVRIASG